MAEGSFDKNLYRRRMKEHREIVSRGVRYPNWNFKDSELAYTTSSFEQSFSRMVPDLRHHTEHELANRKGDAIGIEFGGPGGKMFRGFSKSFFKKTIGVTLSDPLGTNEDEQRLREESRHQVVRADITHPETYALLCDQLNAEKADVIFERLAGGFTENPRDAALAIKLLSRWYDFLREDGLMLVQVPVAHNSMVAGWVRRVQSAYEDTLTVRYVQGTENGWPGKESILYLRKRSGAPEKLPFLKDIAEKPPDQDKG